MRTRSIGLRALGLATWRCAGVAVCLARIDINDRMLFSCVWDHAGVLRHALDFITGGSGDDDLFGGHNSASALPTVQPLLRRMLQRSTCCSTTKRIGTLAAFWHCSRQSATIAQLQLHREV